MPRAILRLSWREFQTLLRGLSPNSATLMQLEARQRKTGIDEDTISDPEEVDRAMHRMFA